MENLFITTKEEYKAVKAAWISRKHHEAWEHIIYNALRNKPINLGFCGKKLSNEKLDWTAYEHALAHNIMSLNIPFTLKPVVVDEGKKMFGVTIRERKIDYVKSPRQYVSKFKEMFWIELTEDLIKGLIRMLESSTKNA